MPSRWSHEDERAFLADFPALVDAIVAELNQGQPVAAVWRRKPHHPEDEWGRHYHDLTGPDGAALSLHFSTGRLSISASFPQGYQPRGTSYTDFRITVDGNKPAAAIARDLGRRLLPKYLAELPGCLAAKRQDEAGAESARMVANELADFLGTRRPRAEDRSPFRLYATADTIYSVTVQHPGVVKIETAGSLSPALALDVLRVLTGTPIVTEAELTLPDEENDNDDNDDDRDVIVYADGTIRREEG